MDLNGFLSSNAGLIQPALWAAAFVAAIVLLRLSNIFRYTPNNQVALSKSYGQRKVQLKAGSSR